MATRALCPCTSASACSRCRSRDVTGSCQSSVDLPRRKREPESTAVLLAAFDGTTRGPRTFADSPGGHFPRGAFASTRHSCTDPQRGLRPVTLLCRTRREITPSRATETRGRDRAAEVSRLYTPLVMAGGDGRRQAALPDCRELAALPRAAEDRVLRGGPDDHAINPLPQHERIP